MNSEAIYAGLVTLFGLAAVYFGFLKFRKHAFLHTEEYNIIRGLLPFPAIMNFWILKLFFVIAGSIVVYFGIYGVISNL